jgi:hypothetical protein
MDVPRRDSILYSKHGVGLGNGLPWPTPSRQTTLSLTSTLLRVAFE